MLAVKEVKAAGGVKAGWKVDTPLVEDHVQRLNHYTVTSDCSNLPKLAIDLFPQFSVRS
jgi:hypothetical protein